MGVCRWGGDLSVCQSAARDWSVKSSTGGS